MTSPCSGTWAGYQDLLGEVADLHPPDVWCRYLGLASEILWSATGRRWRGGPREAEAVLRAAPPRLGEQSGSGSAGWAYHSSWGVCGCWAGVAGGLPVWGPGAGHAAPARVRLPHPDVTAIVNVLVDGSPFTGWRLDGPWLTRIDGQGWPTCHDRAVVVYEYGRMPPDGGRLAAAELAAELGKAAAPDSDLPCRLPERARSITRQGISFEVLDPMTFLDDGRTGLFAVDAWIAAVNPYKRRQPGRVWSPDLARARRTS